VITLASCGGGGDDETPSPNVGWVTIDSTFIRPGSTKVSFFVILRGMTFSGTNNVSWKNETTGESGQASHGVAEFSDCFIGLCFSEFAHLWDAEIRVVKDEKNVSRVTASDGAGNFGTATFIRLPDVEPPTIISMHPGKGETGIAPNSGVMVVFSEPMDSSTITPATVLLKDSFFGNRVAATVSSASHAAFIEPIEHLNASTRYTVTITTEVKDLEGNALASSRSWAFTTGVDLAIHLGF